MPEFEKISSFADGELDVVEHEAVIVKLATDRCARGAWARYHMIGDILRECTLVNPAAAFADTVRQLVGVEPTVLAPRRGPQLVRPLTGLAIAASVATIAVIATHNFEAGDIAVTPLAAEASLDGKSTTPVELSVGGAEQPAQIASATPEYERHQRGYRHDRRLNSYLVNFNEQRSSLGVPGVHPYVRIVGYEAR